MIKMTQFLTAAAIISALVLAANTTLANPNIKIHREDGSPITYYLKKNSSKTLLVLLQGSDCNSVAHNEMINHQFSKAIPNSDVLTVEKYGITQAVRWNASGDSADCPESYITHDSPQQRANDYLQVIARVNSRNDYDDIVVLGGSEGALVAAMVAANNTNVTALISLNAGGRFFIDDVLYNMQLELPPQAFDEAEQGFRAFADKIIHSESIPIQMSGHGYQWWKHMLTIDQTDILSSVKAPTLLIQAALDQNVSPALAADQARVLSKPKNQVESSVNRQANSNFKYVSFEGVDHKFKDQQGKIRAHEVVLAIQEWYEDLRTNTLDKATTL
ncbi:Uncharacterised protein [BD1-7 clade bacterium]|uniref:Uncharacterized protein n=1 Tax=BD1-7 clade bacterium TaxID=2029982 RepID=A0A5S9PHX5_9GAMM|nr:Uncharacterised protein [BD1-7 clade bacterium]CAA0103366.1 Uncharacterised protein [BD1-7 clade bacterium]